MTGQFSHSPWLQLFDVALDAIIAMDASGKVTAWNRSAERTFGYSKVEALGQNLAGLIIPARLRNAHDLGLRRYKRTGRGPLLNRRIEVPALHRGGYEFPIELTIVAVAEQGKEVFYGFLRDLRERTAAQQAESLHRQTEQQFRRLVDGVTDYAICMLDPDGCVTTWNSGAQRIKGYSADEIIGKHVSQFYTEEDCRAGKPDEMLETAKRQGRFETESWRVRKGGSKFWAHVVVDAIRDESGGLLGFAKVTRDITERQRAREAQHASEAKTQFLATMSHEIRTPLNGIIGYTERLMDEDLAPNQRRFAERIQTAGSMLLTIVDDILDFSQIEAGRIELEEQPFLLEALIDNTVSIVAGVAEEKGLSLRVDLGPNLPKILVGDEARLRQVILNLLNNAVKFTHKGHISLAVHSEGQSGDREILRFEVTDTGIGIPAHRRDRLFRRFSQVDRSVRREFGGTGLGLAISKRLIELFGGEIGVESEEGRGSRFWIKVALPSAEAEDIRGIEEGAPEPTVSARILIAEDLEINQDLARSILEKAGHTVDVVADGAQAVAAVRARAYDLVLMDIQMPVMDGIKATMEIRQLDAPKSCIPIIAMTANVLPQQIRSFKQAGMDDHIGKPMKRADLLKKINEWLPTTAMLEESPPDAEGSPRPLFDQDTFDQLRNLVGSERISDWIRRLDEQIQSAFGEGSPGSIDREELGRMAHTLVSHAGSLGFVELSDCCGVLEDACLNRHDILQPFESAQRAAKSSLEVLSELRRRESA